jgi:hypothetical protein
MSEDPRTPEQIAADQATAEAAAQAQAESEESAAKAKTEAEAAAKKGRPVKARLLQACAHGQANDLVTLPEAEAKTLEAAGILDTHKAAVAYAATLEQNQK